MFLETAELIDILRTHDTIDLDVTVNGLETLWRQDLCCDTGYWACMVAGQVNLQNAALPFVTTNVSINLSDPLGDGTQNWKAAAQKARDDLDSGAQTDAWWQFVVYFPG